ncbi:MAG: hypothetical protein R3E48_08720 [Burkholderiaceae bacterium]
MVSLGAQIQASAEVVTEYWIGRPGIGAYIQRSLVSAGRSAMDYRRAAAAGQLELAQARKAYFTATPDKKAAAGDELGDLLLAKDIQLAAGYISNGWSKQSKGIHTFLALLNGGRAFDGGIHASARPTYDAWIRAMRKHLGAKNDVDMVWVTQASLLGALKATQSVYAVYRKERDPAERRAWAAGHGGSTAARNPMSTTRKAARAAPLAGRPSGQQPSNPNRAVVRNSATGSSARPRTDTGATKYRVELRRCDAVFRTAYAKDRQSALEARTSCYRRARTARPRERASR